MNIFNATRSTTVRVAIAGAAALALLGGFVLPKMVAHAVVGVHTIAITNVSAAEGTGAGTTPFTFVVSLSPVSATPITVQYKTTDGSATSASGDYAAIGLTTLTFNPGETSKNVTVNVTKDGTFEADETFTVDLSNAPDATITDNQGLGTIQNDDFGVVVNDISAAEGNGGGTTPFTFTVSVTPPSPSPVTVHYQTTDGTARAAGDYAAIADTLLSFAANEASKQVTVNVAADTFAEPDETFTVDLSNATGAPIVDAQGVGTVQNDDAVAPVLAITGPSPVTETNASQSSPATFTVTLTPAAQQPVSVTYTTVNGTASAGEDYTATGGVLTFAAGETSKPIDVTVLGADQDENDETFRVNLSNPDNATASPSTATATIVDNDAPPTVTINSPTAIEGAQATTTPLTFTVTLSGVSQKDVTVNYATGDSAATPKATAGNDYIARSNSLMIPAGAVSGTFVITVVGDNADEQLQEFFAVTLSGPDNATLGDPNVGTGTIQDDDATPVFSVNSVPVSEGNAGAVNAIVTVSLSAASGQTLTVDFATGDPAGGNPATPGADYTATTGTLTFNAGELSKTVNVPVNGDVLDEFDETFEVTLSNVTPASGATVSPTPGVVTIIDDDAQPTVNVVADVEAVEGNSGATPMTFTFELSAPSGRDVTFTVNTTNPAAPPTATEGSDYVSADGTAKTIPAGVTSTTLDINALGDTTDEPNEEFTVTLANGGNVTLGASKNGTINDDDPGPQLNAGSDQVTAEGNAGTSTMTFTVSKTGPTDQASSVAFTTVNGSATSGGACGSGVDFVATSGTLSFAGGAPGETSKNVVVTVCGDVLAEPDEEFTLMLSNPMSATIGDAEAVGTITNDDGAAPTVSVANAADTTEAPGANASFEFKVTGAVTQTVTVNYTTVDGPETGSAAAAVEPGDYTKKSGSVTFEVAGPATQVVLVAVIDDPADEPDEFFHIDITSVTNASVSDGTGQAKIVDNDNTPAISVEDELVDENVGTTSLAVTLSNPSASQITVGYATANGTATQPGDYGANSGTLTFAPGEMTKNVDVAVVDDTLDELAETVNVTLSSPTNATIADGTGVLTITDNDAQPTVSVNSATAAEGDKVTFNLTLSAASGQDVVVTLGTADGTATAADYTALPATTMVTIPAGTPSALVEVQSTEDTIAEPGETFTINLSAATNATVSPANGTGTGTINDDDGQPTITIADKIVAEDVGSAMLTVSLSNPSSNTVSVQYATADGTATQPGDYTTATGPLSFAPGEMTKNIAVPVVNDTLDEAAETLNVTLSSPTNATIADGTGVLTITDNDGSPTVSVDSASAEEGAPVTFTLNLSPASGQDVTVTVNTSNGTAAAGDYTGLTNSSVTIAAGATTKTVEVATTEDTLDEGDETFTLTLSAPTSATLGAATGTGTINDDDAAPTVSVGNAAATEGDKATFTVSLSAASGKDVTVTATTANGTAGSGDYTALAGATVMIPAGTSSKAVDVQTTPDALDEPDETFTLTLSAPTNATLGTASGTGTITDDDGQPVVSIDSVSATEGGTATFTASLTEGSSQPITVKYATADGTATQPGDYAGATGTLSFAPGETTKPIAVTTAQDTLDEAGETFAVTLSAPTNATLSPTNATGTGTINDDDAAPTVLVNSASGAEGDKVTLTLTLTAASGQDVVVTLGTADGTATAADYTALPGTTTVTIPAGTTSKAVEVQTTEDTADEPDETFTLTLSAATNATVDQAKKTGTGTITDDDEPPTNAKVTTGAGPGGGPHIRTFKADGAAEGGGFMDGSDSTGKRVARGDLNGDGIDEIITGAGPNSPSVVSVYSAAGALVASSVAYNAFNGGVFVGAGDVDGDGKDEVITGAGAGGGPHVRVWKLAGTALTGSTEFMAYGNFTGGVSVAAGDVDGDGKAEVITGAGPGGGPHVQAFNAATAASVRSFYAYASTFTGGVFVAAGDLDGDGTAEFVTGVGPGGGPHLRTFNSDGSLRHGGIYSGASTFTGGITVAAGDLDGDGKAEIIVGTFSQTNRVTGYKADLSAIPGLDFAPYGGFGGGNFVAVGKA